MVVAVHESKANPYFNLFEETEDGFYGYQKIHFLSAANTAPPVYQYNGNLYIINAHSLNQYSSLAAFRHIKKYVVPIEYGIDIDSPADWNNAEYLLNNQLVTADGEL